MNIVIVDGETAIHGDLSWDGLRSIATVSEYPYTTPDQLLQRLKDADGVLTNKVPFSRETMNTFPKLKYIGVTATGYNIVDLKAAREQQIAVTNVPAYSSASVVQHVFALLLSYVSPISRYDSLVRSGAWSKSSQFSLLEYPLSELQGKNIGILGFGEIGRGVAEVARAFGMNVLIGSLPGREYPDRLPVESMLEKADIVSLHCPLTPATKNIVNKSFLERMKSSALLINTARGGLINENDLAEALKTGTIAHAFLDVLGEEPPRKENPLIGLSNVTITPHIAWGTREARQRLVNESIENIAAFARGEKRNRVEM